MSEIKSFNYFRMLSNFYILLHVGFCINCIFKTDFIVCVDVLMIMYLQNAQADL